MCTQLACPTPSPQPTQVLASPGHVALYDYDTAAGSWVSVEYDCVCGCVEQRQSANTQQPFFLLFLPFSPQRRKDVEGSLFLLRRSTTPVYQLFILNKKGTVNHAEDVRGVFQFEDASPYLLYRNARDEVVGVWFYDKDAIAGVVAQLQALAAGGEAGGGGGAAAAPAAPAPAAAAPPSQEGDNFWDTPASVPTGYDPLGGGGGGGGPAAAPATPAAPPPASPAAASGNRLASLLSSAAARAPVAPAPPPVAPRDGGQGAALTALLQGGGGAAPPPPPATAPPAASRDSVRRALLALAGDDAFLDAVAARLAAAL